MEDGNQQQQMDEEDEDEEEESPDNGNNGDNMNGGMNTDDYEEIDYKICGELGKKVSSNISFFRGEEQSS